MPIVAISFFPIYIKEYFDYPKKMSHKRKSPSPSVPESNVQKRRPLFGNVTAGANSTITRVQEEDKTTNAVGPRFGNVTAGANSTVIQSITPARSSRSSRANSITVTSSSNDRRSNSQVSGLVAAVFNGSTMTVARPRDLGALLKAMAAGTAIEQEKPVVGYKVSVEALNHQEVVLLGNKKVIFEGPLSGKLTVHAYMNTKNEPTCDATIQSPEANQTCSIGTGVIDMQLKISDKLHQVIITDVREGDL